MAWGFEADPEFQAKPDWMEAFARDKVECLMHFRAGPDGAASPNLMAAAIARELAASVWADRACATPDAVG